MLVALGQVSHLLCQLSGLVGIDTFIRNLDRAFFQRMNAQNAVQKGAFSTAVSSHQAEDFTWPGFKCNILKNKLLAVGKSSICNF